MENKTQAHFEDENLTKRTLNLIKKLYWFLQKDVHGLDELQNPQNKGKNPKVKM